MKHQSKPDSARRPRLLIVEDDDMIRSLLVDVLADEFQVTCCTGSAAALLEMERGAIDVVLVDFMLPGGGSRDLAARAAVRGAGVVWMTGDPFAVAAALDGAPHILLSKPFALDDVAVALNKALALAAPTSA